VEADDGVSTRAGIDLASPKGRGVSRRHDPGASQKKRKMLNPRNKSYDVGIILRDLVSLQAKDGRLP
jgi:hypothetical protein